MKYILLFVAVCGLSSCSNLTPEQNTALFNAGLSTANRIVDRSLK